MDSIEFYRSFHTSPANKLIHFICIPMIVLSILNFLSRLSLQIKLPISKKYLSLSKILKPTFTIDENTISGIYNLYYYIAYNFIAFLFTKLVQFTNFCPYT